MLQVWGLQQGCLSVDCDYYFTEKGKDEVADYTEFDVGCRRSHGALLDSAAWEAA
jgi:hypothetical protein